MAHLQQQYMEQLQSAMGGQTHVPGTSRTEEALAPALNNAATPITAEPVTENGTSGVESTVFVKRPSAASDKPNANLQLELPRPDVDLDANPLKDLEQIEDQLCSLLDTASCAVRMLTGAKSTRGHGSGTDAGNTKLESMVEEFMATVAKVHADLRYQHKKLVRQGIPVEIVAGYQSDVAGFERDLVSWSDAADLLATALDSGLRITTPSE
ncbi:hypothetical protein H4R23_006205 [Coemansia sp. Cherry 401B]|nr:hypothetical protein H4R23_006205 [Coemansia sp. Cherry 401B]